MMTSTTATLSNDELAAELNAWLDAHWDDERRCAKGTDRLDVKSWLGTILDAGYSVPTWSPQWFGRGYDSRQARVIDDILKARRVIGRSQDRYNLGAVTVYRLGSEQLKSALLREMLTGAHSCLLYSEPNAGSDLAGVRTKAEWVAGEDGGEYVITGQKVWTSNAKGAAYGMLLARTDWDVPKHSGITFFIFPMNQDGVDIRPINQITGESEFNEIFINEARVPARNIVGELNGGWKVLQTALAYERLIMDVIRGNQTLFMRGDEVEAAWAWTDPIIAGWEARGDKPQGYDPGSSGPEDALMLLHRDSRRWREIKE